MKKPSQYNLTPARGQALLSFQGRIFPKTFELFEVQPVEEVRQNEKQIKLLLEKQNKLNSDFRNLLIQGDCLSACAYLKSKDIKVDLVYIDPPFASGANYAKTLFLRTGKRQGQEIEDKKGDIPIGEEVLYGDIWQKEDYLNWLYERLLAIRDIMSEKGSIYVHLDWHIGPYVKVLLDEIFGEENFKNEIVWLYRKLARTSNQFPKSHDNIYFYGKSVDNVFNVQYTDLSESTKKRWGNKMRGGKDPDKRYATEDESLGAIMPDFWDIPLPIGANPQKTEYSTQKPEQLLKTIIEVSSDEGMIVADFFVGSGTTAKVAQDSGRKFIACDIGVNAIQTTRDRLVKAGANFDVLKVNDGVRLFRNPTQTTAKIFGLIDGFKTRTELGLGDFWDGGIIDSKGEYVPVKFVQIHDRLTKELLDVLLEEIYQLQDVTGAVSKTKVIYAHIDPEIDQSYVNKAIKAVGKTTIEVDLVKLEDLLGEKANKLFMPDSADVIINETGLGSRVEIKHFYSPYLKTKIDEYNSRKVTKGQITLDDEIESISKPKRNVSISDNGLELIEAVQIDTTLRKDGVWTSNIDLEDKAGIKDKIKAVYQVPTKKFKMKIRNIAGDEIIIDSDNIRASKISKSK